MALKVKAKIITGEPKKVAGYRDHKRIYEGQEFEIEHEGQFSDRWMEPVGWRPEKRNKIQVSVPGKVMA
jgi:hypothetical protein